MKNILSKVFAIIMIILLLINMTYYAMAKVSLFFFWVNLGILGIITYFIYGDKTKLKKMLNMK